MAAGAMGGSLRRALVPAIAVLALVGVVAIAASGPIANGSNRTRNPPDVLLDTIITLGLVALVPAAAMLVYGLAQRRAVSEHYARAKHKRLTNQALILLLLLIPVLLYFRHPQLRPPDTSDKPTVIGPGHTPVTPPVGTEAKGYEPHFAWLPA